MDCTEPDGLFQNSTLGDTLFSDVTNPVINQINGFYDETGKDDIWRDDFTKTLTLKGDIVSQYSKHNMLKSGISLQFNNLHYVDIADGATNLSAYGEQYFTMPSDSITYASLQGLCQNLEERGGYLIQSLYQDQCM